MKNNGIGIIGLLGVCFVVLKLCKVIDWSWWWVTAPFWGGIALILGLLAIIALIALLAKGTTSKKRRDELKGRTIDIGYRKFKG